MEDQWELSFMMNQNRIQEVVANIGPPTDEDIQRLVNDLHNEFVPQEDDENNFIPQPSELFTWGAQRFHMELNSVSFSELHDKYQMRQYQLLALANFWKNSSLSEDDMLKDQLMRIANVIKHTYDSFKEMALLYHRMDPGRDLRIPDDTPIDHIFNYSTDKLTNFQKLVINLERQRGEYKTSPY